MEDKLKKFTEAHREDFDLYEPSESLWQRIETGIPQAPVKRMVPTRVRIMQVAVAAAIVAVALFLMVGLPGSNKKQENTGITKEDTPVKEQNIAAKETITQTPEALPEQKANPTGVINTELNKQKVYKKGNTLIEESQFNPKPLNTFAVNKKQEQYVQNVLKKEAPVLHERFSEDLAALQQQYAFFEKELKKNTNRDRIIEAMQRNLEMQHELVNRQLNVIKEIKQLKNSKNEYTTKKIT
jgi:hypothetical protein